MSLDNLDEFTTLIQLICAVNFAYIITKFHSSVYQLFFNEDKLLEEKFNSFTNEVTVDVESLQSMEPIETTKNTSNESTLNQLKQDYDNLSSDWEVQKQNIIDLMHKVKDAKGIRSFFLYISLYCLVVLFIIAIRCCCQDKVYLDYSIAIFSILSISASILFIVRVFFYRWISKPEVDCFKLTLKSFIFIFLASILLPFVFIYLFKCGNIATLFDKISFYSSVILPFMACAISVVFILLNERKIKRLAGNGTAELRKTQKELHSKKITLDESYKMFNQKPPKFE